MAKAAQLAGWTGPEVAAECRTAYSAYKARKTAGYSTYFAANPHLKADGHAYSAKDLAAALPDDWAALDAQLPQAERHRYYLSGNSSQVLALGLLGVATRLDPSLRWLWEGLSPLPGPTPSVLSPEFEFTLDEQTLGEKPRQTSIDYFVDDASAVICLEAKWTEEGIGGCSCARSGGKPLTGACATRVEARSAYWDVAYEVFRMPKREHGKPCPLSFTYQAVRNVAAALALARPGQAAVFALVYDEHNPYFGGCGAWPGWPEALRATLEDAHPRLLFRSVSWQELMQVLPLDDSARLWADEKHALSATMATS